jgi:DNA repair protein SbcD/Mre11
MAYVAGRSREPFDRFEVEAGPGRKIAVLHGSLDAPWSDRSVPLRSEHLAELGLDYVALGHIHRAMDKRLRQGWVCYPGRIEGSGFSDPGGAELVRIDLAEESLRPERIPFPSRPISLVTWNASGLAREEELAARLEEIADPRAIVRLSLTGLPGFDLDPASIQRRFADRFFHLEVEASEALPPSLLDGLAEERTARGSFVRLARAEIAAANGDEERNIREAALRYGLAAFAAGDASEATAAPRGAER